MWAGTEGPPQHSTVGTELNGMGDLPIGKYARARVLTHDIDPGVVSLQLWRGPWRGHGRGSWHGNQFSSRLQPYRVQLSRTGQCTYYSRQRSVKSLAGYVSTCATKKASRGRHRAAQGIGKARLFLVVVRGDFRDVWQLAFEAVSKYMYISYIVLSSVL